MPWRLKSMRRRGPAARIARLPDDDHRSITLLGIVLMAGGLAFTLLLISP
jgi:hypothetical protein